MAVRNPNFFYLDQRVNRIQNRGLPRVIVASFHPNDLLNPAQIRESDRLFFRVLWRGTTEKPVPELGTFLCNKFDSVVVVEMVGRRYDKTLLPLWGAVILASQGEDVDFCCVADVEVARGPRKFAAGSEETEDVDVRREYTPIWGLWNGETFCKRAVKVWRVD
jgi:hypothetical protein